MHVPLDARLRSLWGENRPLVLFVVLMTLFRSSFADWNDVPTGSMEPTILPGDRILVDKLAYDLRLPLLGTRLATFADPARGEIVVFDSAAADKRLVKRVIGLPGDLVALQDNQLWLNGAPVALSRLEDHETGYELLEALPGAAHRMRLEPRPSFLASFPALRVPADHYLVLGDDRDRSADSRVFGLVPREEIIGRTRRVVLSLDRERCWLPRPDRWLTPI
ncbi:MAG: signal peptidase I [Pseudomonadales bacterium]|jgi:signal peptidase I|nr:signal peptidase I [Pseudomonadales bacterium]